MNWSIIDQEGDHKSAIRQCDVKRSQQECMLEGGVGRRQGRVVTFADLLSSLRSPKGTSGKEVAGLVNRRNQFHKNA